MKNIAIIGGGISGIFSAYFLHKSGHKVTVFEESKIGVECSYGNAGLVVPSHFEALANPAVLKKGIKWMLNPNSPFFLKPRFDLDLLKWIIKFNSFCTKKNVENNKYFLRDISLYSSSLYKELMSSDDFDFDYRNTGLLMMCKEEKTLKEEEHLIKEANELGLKGRILNQNELKDLEPEASFDVVGAAYYEDDGRVQPYDLIMAIKNYLEKQGVIFKEDCKIVDTKVENSKIKSIVDKQGNVYEADEFIFTMGVFTSKMAKKFNLNLPMEGGKGFSFTVDKTSGMNFSTPMILAEEKVAITPYDSYVRYAGTMMICGEDKSIVQRRVDNIRNAANKYINNIDIKQNQMQDLWAGLRPCSPDGIPFIGRSKELSNLIIATGHAMIGVSLGPSTGKIVTSLVDEQKPDIDIEKMNLYRF
ncbi:amino acid dehydrogenase [Arcobacter sp. CECT 8986]|uniref:NAD(P)/FAD-dependent oxidoreductase n=1 Tax=Arcobacter sp. CECT 8986 TaxID=2044507 RepID=UPI001009FD3E|nr:FAD-dependent oxidoreductase [Arcobacter sp. CECT 8986]RXJ98816.1 amino acid dehydrogenase [Arcobacter sp. CECT 8986]